jgi:hydroxypyruvate reductase
LIVGVVPAGASTTRPSFPMIVGGHPAPTAESERGGREALRLAGSLRPHETLVVLLSGGASALMAVPADGISLLDKQTTAQQLMRAGADIHALNTVRKHLSAIKGGRLAAAAAPARVVSLLISDVPGDDPAVIASGPTVADPTTFADALAVLEKYRIDEPAAAIARLRKAQDETPKPGDLRLARVATTIIARPQDALEAAAAAARQAGMAPLILGDSIEGEARDVALVHAGIARQVRRHGQPVPAPAVLLSGGETTVTVRGRGRGGRNAEFLLALAVALNGEPGIHAVAGDTDGIDGTEDNAGALLDPTSLARGAAAGVDAKKALADNDGYGFFAALGDLIVTGPTRTNVNDFRAILIETAS